MRTLRTTVLLVSISLPPAAAQSLAQSVNNAPAAARQLGTTPFLTPIRATALDAGTGGDLWASGAGYKAKFDDGVAFYPVLGASAPRNLPLRWRTRAISAGGQSVLGPLAAAQAHATPWRYELRYGAVTEAYDVRDEGVEQTFVLHARPAQDGDLVIVGAVESELRAPTSAWQHGDLVFADAQGTPRVRYGAAVAIDANGERTPMETSYDGGNIGLRLSGAWLAGAAFPVVVDPLLTPTTLVSYLDSIGSFDVARDDVGNDLFVVYRRAMAANDFDGFGRLVPDNLAGMGSTVFSDVSPDRSDLHLSVAFVGGTNKWIVAISRILSTIGPNPYLRYHLRDSGDTTVFATVTGVARPANESWLAPDVGGTVASASGNAALIVFEAADPAAPLHTEVCGMFVNTSNDTYGAPFPLPSMPAGNTYDRAQPRVNKESSGGSSAWMVVYSEINRTIANDDYDVFVARVTTAGTVSRFALPSTVADHKLAPVIDGRDGRYMVLYGVRAQGHGVTWMHSLRARRVNFSDGAGAPSFLAESPFANSGEFYPWDIAYDGNTMSHWTATYYSSAWDAFATRFGYDAGVAESVVVHDGASSSYMPALCFNDDTQRYQIAYPVNQGGLSSLTLRDLVYPATAATVHGIGCGGVIAATAAPYAGSEFFAVRGSGMQTFTPAVLLCALTPADIPLDALGMPGCSLLVSPASLLFALNAMTGGTGIVQVQLPLPTAARGVDVHFQWAHIAIGANSANLRATARLQVPVR
jgi:hypothetical protein